MDVSNTAPLGEGHSQDSIIALLTESASQKRLIERAFEGCEACFKDEAGGLIAGWSSQELTKQFFSHSLTFQHCWGLVYIDTTLKLTNISGQEVGRYRLITKLDGETDDDYLIFDIVKDA